MEIKEIIQVVEVTLPEKVDIQEVINNAFKFLETENIGENTKCEVKVSGENTYIITFYSTHAICFSCCKQYLTLKLKQLKGNLKWHDIIIK